MSVCVRRQLHPPLATNGSVPFNKNSNPLCSARRSKASREEHTVSLSATRLQALALSKPAQPCYFSCPPSHPTSPFFFHPPTLILLGALLGHLELQVPEFLGVRLRLLPVRMIEPAPRRRVTTLSGVVKRERASFVPLPAPAWQANLQQAPTIASALPPAGLVRLGVRLGCWRPVAVSRRAQQASGRAR